MHKQPVFHKSVIDKEELLAIIKEIRALMPDEVTQAVWINKERNRNIK